MDYLPSDFFLGFTVASALSLTITIILLFASAFMSASEVAFFSLSPSDIKKLDKDSKSDRAIKQLLSNPQKLLATILTGNNFINIAIVILSAYTVNKLLNFGDHTILEFIFQTVIITFILLLFGEIIPKISATILGVKLARRNAVLLLAIEKMLTPVSAILMSSTVLIDKKLSKHQHKNISVEELETALKITATPKDKGTTDNEILQGIVNFGNINASQVMTSRLNMTSLDIATPFKKVLEVVIESGYSRLPVFSKSEDDIRGILYVKDLLPHLDKGDNFRWQTLIRNAYFVPETKKIDDLLTDFKKSRIHIAIVVDEFGGTSGVITMKDILEEIISNLGDEYDDEEEPMFKKTGDNTFRIEARIPVNDLFKIEEIDENDFDDFSGDIETLAGLLLEINGEIPKPHDKIKYKKYDFEIEKADDRHIESVMLTITPDKNEDNEEDKK